MTVDQIHTTSPSLADLKAQVALLEAEAGNVTREMARPVVEHLLTTNVFSASKSSAWVGFSSDSLDITVDGKKVSFKVVVTDVEATEARKPAFTTDKAKKQANDLTTKLAALNAQIAAGNAS